MQLPCGRAEPALGVLPGQAAARLNEGDVYFGAFQSSRIGFENFLRAYEASLRTERMRAIGDLECAFRYFAGDEASIAKETLSKAFREITPISFSDAEVREMIDRVAQSSEDSWWELDEFWYNVHLKGFKSLLYLFTSLTKYITSI